MFIHSQMQLINSYDKKKQQQQTNRVSITRCKSIQKESCRPSLVWIIITTAITNATTDKKSRQMNQ